MSLKKIFSWEDWQDFGDDAFEMYINCVLLKKVGDFEEGSEFSSVYFDKRLLLLTFYKGNEQVMEKRFVLEN